MDELIQASEQEAVVDTSAIEKLLDEMGTRKNILFGALQYCVTPRAAEDVNALIDEAQQYNRSVYSAANLCTLLMGAGALERVDEAGNPYLEGENEPLLIDIDGEKFYRVAEPPKAFWSTTAAGRKVLSEHDPRAQFAAMLTEDAPYPAIYARILTMAAAEEGTTTVALSAACDEDPVMLNPRMYVQYFIDRLEKVNAIEWRNRWQITDTGREILSQLLSGKEE